ncbi:hypothetical protein INR49_008381 [Caranx melampygus]|nr:hypothetical protein INR49_008381 [Caranx melampygus]
MDMDCTKPPTFSFDLFMKARDGRRERWSTLLPVTWARKHGKRGHQTRTAASPSVRSVVVVADCGRVDVIDRAAVISGARGTTGGGGDALPGNRSRTEEENRPSVRVNEHLRLQR